jgi:tetratricopeptide (TPR) repeat protein
MGNWGMEKSNERIDDSMWFRRFRFSPTQTIEIREQIIRNQQVVAANSSPLELLSSLLELTWALTPLDRQTEAVILGERSVGLARAEGLLEIEIEALLHTATAVQYTGDQHRAADLFEEAVRRVDETGHTEYLHYILHHYGRLKAEISDPDSARSLLERALELRERSGDAQLITSTRQALAELTRWCANSHVVSPLLPAASSAHSQ